METDWAFGQVLASIESAGLQDNTLVIFTSDNGCAPYIGVKDLEAEGTFPRRNSEDTRPTSGKAGIVFHSPCAGREWSNRDRLRLR